MIISREEGENNFLQGYRNQFITMQVADFAGPLVMIDGVASAEDLALAARITTRFGKAKTEPEVTVEIRARDGSVQKIKVSPMSAADIDQSWYI